MKKSKRILALVLVLALAFTSFAMLASASEADVEERDAYSCPVCGTVLRHYTDTDVVQTIQTTCPRSSSPHTHVLKNVYSVEDCPSCDYMNKAFSYQVIECRA